MVELSARTDSPVRVLFSEDQVAEVVRLLAEECANNFPLVRVDYTPASLERLRFAALRLSAGDMGRLREAIKLAKLDWRDLLVAADLANDIHAH